MSAESSPPADFSWAAAKRRLGETVQSLLTWVRREPLQALLVALAAATLIYYYGFYRVYLDGSQSAARWTVNSWNEENDLEHGWMVLPIALIVVWWHRQELAAAPKETSPVGLAITGLGVFLFVYAAWTLQGRLAILSAAVLAYGSVRFLWGRATAQLILFPCAFLFFMVPVGFLTSRTVELQNLSASVAQKLSAAIGIGIHSQGDTLIANDHSFQFEVTGGCSGIRSLMAMMMLSALYVHFTQRALWKKAIVFASSLFFALLGNFMRIFSVVVMARFVSVPLAGGLYHDWSGFVFFPFAVGGMIGFGNLLNYDWPGLWRRSLQPEPAPAPSQTKPGGPISYDY